MSRYVLFILVCFFVKTALATTYYVSLKGSDSNAGTSHGAPLLTPDKAVLIAIAGDTIIMRGGTYMHSATLTISKNGTADKRYTLKAWPGEKPILDFSGTASGKRGISLNSSYWTIMGISIIKAGDNGMIISGGAYNLIENCTFSENKDSGLQLGAGAHDNRIINCDSYYNADPPDFGDADGFAPKMDVGSNNYFYGCRSWQNCDDGWDGYLRGANNVTTTLENCWTWGNGYFRNWTDAGANANGNGFKMGGSDDKTLQHNFILKNCLAFDNKAKGFDQNNNKGSITIYNGTGFRNKGYDFSIPSPLAAGQTAIVRNCLLAQGKVSLGTFVLQGSNSWNGSFTVTPDDFLSLDTTGVGGPRKSDGSLPDLLFAHLAPGSDLINSGTDVGLPFMGGKPDLGCFETGETVGIFTIGNEKPAIFNLKIFHSGSQTIFTFDPSGETFYNYELWRPDGSLVWRKRNIFPGKADEKICIPDNRFPPGIYVFRLSEGINAESIKIKLP